MRISRFYAGQRAIPPQYAGLAAAALASALLLPFLPPNANPQSAAQTAPMVIMIGLGAGFALAFCGSGPLLRKTGAFSIADLVAGRFPHSSARLLAACVCAIAAALVTMAGLAGAADGLVQVVGLSREAALVAACFVVLAIAVGVPFAQCRRERCGTRWQLGVRRGPLLGPLQLFFNGHGTGVVGLAYVPEEALEVAA